MFVMYNTFWRKHRVLPGDNSPILLEVIWLWHLKLPDQSLVTNGNLQDVGVGWLVIRSGSSELPLSRLFESSSALLNEGFLHKKSFE